MKLIQTMPARKSLATRRSRWKLHAALVVMCLLLGCVVAASPTDDVVAGDVALPSRITEDAQEFALSLKPSEQWYMEYLLKEWRLKTIVAERKPRSPGELAFAAVVFIAMIYKFTQLLRNMRELRVSFWGIGDPEEEQRPGSGEDSGDEGGDGDGSGVGVGGSEYRVRSDDNLSSPSSSSSSSDVEEHPHAD